MRLRVTNASAKIYLARKGPAKVFGEEVDRRETFSDEAAVAHFDRIWESKFTGPMSRAQRCEVEAVLAKIPTGAHQFVEREAEHLEFKVANCLFIAQLRSPEECDQLWFISSTSGDPRTLYVRFDTVDERRAFERLAAQLGWKDCELGLQLIRDFACKFERH